MAITITGANGQVVSLGDATGRTQLAAIQMQSKIEDEITTGQSVAFDVPLGSGTPPEASGVTGIIQESGEYQLANAYKYIVVANDDATNTGSVTLNSNGFVSNKVSILAGRQSGTTYNANNESGELVNTVGSLVFNGAGKTGAWTIFTGNSDATITTTDGNNQVTTGGGKSSIVLGNGNNSVLSYGQDTITGGGDGYQSITLAGAQSEVVLGDDVYITDIGSDNKASVQKNGTISGGTGGVYSFNTGDLNRFQGGTESTVNATNGSLTVIHGESNTFNVDNNLTLFNPNANTTATVGGQLTAFGSLSSSLTLNATGDNQGLFVADAGNETLNASGSTAGLQIYANTIVGGGNTNFVATGGSGNDTLIAGTGNSTFSGGTGENLFMFTKEVAEEGNTVIRDFNQNDSKNTIALFNYGLDGNSLQALLSSSANDANGNAVLDLTGHTITIEGVSVSDLNVNQFMVANSGTQTA